MKAENRKMGCLCEDRVKPEGNKEPRSFATRQNMEKGGAEEHLSKALERNKVCMMCIFSVSRHFTGVRELFSVDAATAYMM